VHGLLVSGQLLLKLNRKSQAFAYANLSWLSVLLAEHSVLQGELIVGTNTFTRGVWMKSKKTIASLSILFVSLCFFTSGIEQVQTASANYIFIPDLDHICIRADGSINLTSAHIQRTGDTYTLTGNILNYSIEVQRDNIILDGANFTLQGSKENGIQARGVYITDRSNVTIKNLKIKVFQYGIWGDHTTNNSILENEITDTATAIGLVYASNIHIEHNKIAGNT
jgi:hypothetical protein